MAHVVCLLCLIVLHVSRFLSCSLMHVCKQSHTGTTLLTMPEKCFTYWYLLLKGKSMPYRHNLLYFITVLAHLVFIIKRACAIILLSACIIISISHYCHNQCHYRCHCCPSLSLLILSMYSLPSYIF